MKPLTTHSLFGHSFRQTGLTLIELMISMLIGIFLLSGLSYIFSSVSSTYKAQSNLVQLQNNQIQALNILTNLIQSAGYYPNAVGQTQTAAFPAFAYSSLPNQIVLINSPVISPSPTLAISFNAMETIFGGSLYSNGPDTLSIRSTGPTLANSGLCNGATPCPLDCTGTPIINAIATSVLTVSNGYLLCSTTFHPTSPSTISWQNWQVLVSDITSMNIWYGIDPSHTGTAMQYLTAAQMSSANWTEVVNVRVTFTFNNPLNNSATAITTTKVIGIMGALSGA